MYLNSPTEGAKYVCAGNRLFKLPKGAHRGPAKVTYKGNMEGHKEDFRWDVDLTFKVLIVYYKTEVINQTSQARNLMLMCVNWISMLMCVH